MVYSAFTVPVSIVILRSAMRGVSRDVMEAARLEGASDSQVLWHVALPMIRPVIGVVALVQAIGMWNELGLAAALLLDSGAQTLPVGLANQFRGQFGTDLGAQYAGLVLAVVPILVFYVALEPHLRRGLRLSIAD